MADKHDYSSTQAPETRKEAEEQHPHPSDDRLIPGGARGASADTGMESLDRDAVPSRAIVHETDYSRTPDSEAPARGTRGERNSDGPDQGR